MTKRDRWTWMVQYRDGSTFGEYDKTSVQHGWAEVDNGAVQEIQLFEDGKQTLAEVVPADCMAVFTRRRIIPPNAPHYTIHVLGHRGSSEQYTFLFEDGHRVVSSNFDEF